jgi:hypothetical protein
MNTRTHFIAAGASPRADAPVGHAGTGADDAISGARHVFARSIGPQGLRPTAGVGVVSGHVRNVLRLEGLAVLAVSAVAYQAVSGHWGLFAALFLGPDLAFLAYLAGPRAGAFAYNLTHSLIGPLTLLGLGLAAAPAVTPFALIWIAHIGFDRCLGYGLKFVTGFGDTHLGRVGRREAYQTR